MSATRDRRWIRTRKGSVEIGQERQAEQIRASERRIQPDSRERRTISEPAPSLCSARETDWKNLPSGRQSGLQLRGVCAAFFPSLVARTGEGSEPIPQTDDAATFRLEGQTAATPGERSGNTARMGRGGSEK